VHVICQHFNQRSLLLFAYEVLLYLDKATGSQRLRGPKSARLVLLKTWVADLNLIKGYRYVWFLGASVKWRKATISFVMSVRPHGTTWFTLE